MKSFLAFIKIAQQVVAFLESPEGQKLVADLKVAGGQLLAEIKTIETDVEAAKAVVSPPAEQTKS